MMRQTVTLTLLTGVVASAFLLTPTRATAAELAIAGDGGARGRREARQKRRDDRNQALKDRRPDLEGFQVEPRRKGMYVGAGAVVGTSVSPTDFTPSLGYRMEIGGGLTDRLTLGISGGLTGHQGIPSGTAGVFDLVARVYPLWGMFGEAGLGVSSHAPVPTLEKRPGMGGFVGAGYEFRPMKRFTVSFAVDWDVRVRPDGQVVNAVIGGVSLRGFFNVKKK